jgi:hypothetical protein
MAPLHQYVNDAELNLSIMYTGVTSDPPDSVLGSFVNPTSNYERRNPNLVRPLYHAGNKWYTPFWNINKLVIADMYRETNTIGSLFSNTRSCEGLKQLSGHCGDCWWCEERLWAFGRL